MLASKLQPFLSCFMDSEIESQEWYEELVGECKAILTEFGFRSNIERIQMYHELGKRILQENNNFERRKIYGKGITTKVASTIGIGERTIQYAISFATKYPDIDFSSGDLGGLPDGKSITWTKIIRELLPENPIKEKKKKVCPNCGFSLD